MSLLTSLAGPVLGLVGSLFGRKKKQEEVVSRVDYGRMVADAEAAGFNPLTALRNGGAAGFSVTSQPVLSSGHAAIGEAIGNIGNFISNFDPFEDKLRETQYGMMQMQLANMQANGVSAPKRMFDVPAVTGRTKITVNPALALPGSPEAGDLTVTNPWQEAHVDHDVRDAAAVEERYGEIGANLYGGYVGVMDWWANKKRSLSAEFEAGKKRSEERKRANQARKERIRRDAARNANSLGFRP